MPTFPAGQHLPPETNGSSARGLWLHVAPAWHPAGQRSAPEQHAVHLMTKIGLSEEWGYWRILWYTGGNWYMGETTIFMANIIYGNLLSV